MLSKLKTAFCASLFAFAAGTSAQADGEPNLRDISHYFNEIETMQSRFQQYNDDGSVDAGTIYMRRPGRLRMEYDHGKGMVLVSGSTVAVFDGTKSTAEKYPLKKTPLWLLLKPEVDLGRPGAIKSIDHYRDLTRITAFDPENPDIGRMVLEFDNADGNIKFDGWKIRTGLGEKVTTRLHDTETGMPLSNFLFSISHEEEKRSGRD